MCLSIIGTALSLALLLGVTGCGQKPHSPQSQHVRSPASEQWEKIAGGFIEEYFRAQPFFAAQSGKHEYDGQLPDVSEHGIRREIARLHDAREQIAAVDPAPLEPRERFDREYLLAVVDRDLFWMEKARYPFRNPYWYMVNLDPDMYLHREYAPLDVRLKAYIKYARGIPKMATDIQANLKGPMPKTYVELCVADFGGYVDFYKKDVAPIFAAVNDPDLQKQLSDADAVAAQAMANLRDYFISLRKTANDKYALGKDLFAQMVKETESVGITTDEIEAAGRADIDRNTQALKEECAALMPKGTVATCIAKVAANKPHEPPVEAARRQLGALKEFIQKNNVVTIPNDDPVRVNLA